MKDDSREKRLPLWATKVMGAFCIIFSLLFIPGVWQDNSFTVSDVYAVLICAQCFILGLVLLFSKKGLPIRTWSERAHIFQQAREEPDGLNEALSVEERLEHLKIMLEQDALTPEEYEEKRNKIVKGR